jgi:lysine 2,3-aminomutase
VVISGGDPLLLEDTKIEYILKNLRAIPHIEILRIGTRTPCMLPQRITPNLVRMLKKYHPLFINVHFNHPDELTPLAMKALGRLADAGIPLGNQTVLLKGVNDDPAVMKLLMQKLLRARVKPYYIYQADMVDRTEHLRTSVQKGLEIIENLRGWTSGMAVPHFVIDAPEGGGKIPLLPEYVTRITDKEVVMRNYEGKVFQYSQPAHAREELRKQQKPPCECEIERELTLESFIPDIEKPQEPRRYIAVKPEPRLSGILVNKS